MPPVVVSPRARAQIADVLSYTLHEFGETKYSEYRELIGLALETLAATPTAGKRIRERVEVARFLHDAMDLPRQRPQEWTR